MTTTDLVPTDNMAALDYRRDLGMLRRLPIEQRFWLKVRPQSDGCWLWTGATSPTGYGRFNTPHGSSNIAHRFAYELHVGPIPNGLVLDHLCRNRACVNPVHLEPVTAEENTSRGALARTACRKGHPRADHGYVRSDGYWGCRTCVYAARAVRVAERKAA